MCQTDDVLKHFFGKMTAQFLRSQGIARKISKGKKHDLPNYNDISFLSTLYLFLGEAKFQAFVKLPQELTHAASRP